MPNRAAIGVAGTFGVTKLARTTAAGAEGTRVRYISGHPASVHPRMGRIASIFVGVALLSSAAAGPAVAQQPVPQAPQPPAPGATGAASQAPAPAVPAPAAASPATPPSPADAGKPASPATASGPVLRPGMRGGDVGRLQKALRKARVRVPLNGRYDRRTRAGVRIFQRRMRVRATGIADARVLRRLRVRVRAIATGPGTAATFSGFPVPEPDDTSPSAAGFLWPANGQVSSPFGPRWGRIHEGLDIAAPVGRPVRASKAGVAVTVEAQSGYGNLVIIAHGTGETTRYAHLSRFLVVPGQPVAAGQVIAEVGNTGRSTGPHLHFEVRIAGTAVDPLLYL